MKRAIRFLTWYLTFFSSLTTRVETGESEGPTCSPIACKRLLPWDVLPCSPAAPRSAWNTQRSPPCQALCCRGCSLCPQHSPPPSVHGQLLLVTRGQLTWLLLEASFSATTGKEGSSLLPRPDVSPSSSLFASQHSKEVSWSLRFGSVSPLDGRPKRQEISLWSSSCPQDTENCQVHSKGSKILAKWMIQKQCSPLSALPFSTTK